MSTPILTTKLYIPAPRPNIVLRPRLSERLNEGLHRKLILISAPAGFGKTTLLASWLAERQKVKGKRQKAPDDTLLPFTFDLLPFNVAWLSLDEGDNDPARFLAYLVAALQTIAADIGHGVLAALQSPQPPPTEALLTALLNETATIPDDFVLVLDDYHVIDATPIDQALTFLLEHLPPQMHLVIATREDPQLPLARLRARGQLTELRAIDLRFTPTEVAGFLNQAMGLDLAAEDIAALENRTEGWIAGLQLAAISLQGHQDATSFITSFAGSHHFVMDYLVEEVLHQQPEIVQTFLLRTSILDRMCGPLCDAMLEIENAKPVLSAVEGLKIENDQAQRADSQFSIFNSQFVLEELERANLFITPLDNERRWYRYHHLFAEVLRARLVREQPNQIADLHLRACAWCEQNHFWADAIRHALAAGDFERAADLIELERSVNRGTYFQSATWLGWVRALPDEIVRTRPMLSIGYAWELLFSGQLEAAEARMKDAERLLEPAADTDDPSADRSSSMDVANELIFQSQRAWLATARAFHAQALGDAAGTVEYARRALTLIPEADHYPRGLASSLLGLAYLTNGDLETAYTYMADGMASLRMLGYRLFASSGAFVLADVRVAQGRLSDAVSIYEQALQLVAAPGEPVLQTTADLYLGLSELYRERGELEAAKQHLLRSEELGKQVALSDWSYRLKLVQARIKETEGDPAGALKLLEAAEQLYYRTPVPDVRPIAALKTRVWIRQGRLTEALAWSHRQNLSIQDDLSYMREFEHITLARLLIAGYKRNQAERSIHEAVGLLDRLLKAAEAGGRIGSAIEILVLQALAYAAQGNIAFALVPLERALTLADSEGYVRVFVSEGIPMAELLTRMKDDSPKDSLGGTMKAYILRLLAAFPRTEDRGLRTELAESLHSVLSPQPLSLVEPLSQRELEILQLIALGLSNYEISKRLFLALSTVKGHNRNIFGKLQVQSRTEAVARARSLGMV